MYRCREIYLIPITDISITIEYLENIYILNSGVPDSKEPPLPEPTKVTKINFTNHQN